MAPRFRDWSFGMPTRPAHWLRVTLTAAIATIAASLVAWSYAEAAGKGTVAQGAVTVPPSTGSACSYPAPGSVVKQPRDLYSQNGVLSVSLDYYTSVDQQGRTLFCFQTPDGAIAPSLHVRPGDLLIMQVTNRVPQGAFMEKLTTHCGEAVVYDSSLNVHFHGALVSPACTSDDVVDTVIGSGDTFQYKIQIPANEPAGMYWYHPHLHGIADAAVLGGATGAFFVDGLENFFPSLAGMPSRTLNFRGLETLGAVNEPGTRDGYGQIVPTWDVSVNYVPMPYSPTGHPAPPPVIEMKSGQPEVWNVMNGSPDSILDFQLLYDGVPQKLQVVALDGVATGSQDGTRQGKPVYRTTLASPPAGRVQFVVQPPPPGVKAVIQTKSIDTGPAGDSNPSRTIARIVTTANGTPLPLLPQPTSPAPQRFEGLDSAPVSAKRKLYFSEIISNPNDPSSPTNFFITVDGATPQLYSPEVPPAITTTAGSVEEWTIENRATEAHVFHIHQIHFKLLEVNGVPVSRQDSQFYDDYLVDYYHGAVDALGRPIDSYGNIIPNPVYPSIKVKMDFRGPIEGDFVFHCHILQHEDGGMMARMRVLPAKQQR
jgi:FtsP/CotA-like multicopper oxidase with cupredoxin domain